MYKDICYGYITLKTTWLVLLIISLWYMIILLHELVHPYVL